MDFQKQLFYQQTDRITIDIKLGFKDESLFLDGYDRGPLVRELQGSSSYEYMLTVKEAAVAKLYPLLSIQPGDKAALIDALAARFSNHKAYSEIRAWLHQNGIAFDSFTS